MEAHGDIKSTADAESASIPDTPTMPTTTQAMDLDKLPDGYYRSKNFIGSLIAACLVADSLYLGYVLPVNSLTKINSDLGPNPNYSMISTVSTLLADVSCHNSSRIGPETL